MSKLGIVGATALSLALAVATPAFAAAPGGGAMHAGGGGGMHIGVGGGAMHVGGAQASIGGGRVGPVNSGNFMRHDGGQFAHGGYGDHDRHRGDGRGYGFAAGLAAGSALGYAYDGYSDFAVPSDADSSYCAQRYPSYDPASGTYLGDDGLQHLCP